VSKRNRKGGGTVFWDEGRQCWTGQLSYYNDAGERKRPKVHAADETTCWEKLDELRAELKRAGSVAPRDLTVRHVMEDLLAHPPAKWESPLTVRGNENRAKHVIDELGKARLARLTVARVEQFLDGLADDSASSDTIKRCRALLRLAIRRAERDGRSAGTSRLSPSYPPTRCASRGRRPSRR
jgi:hypothetical protein